MDRRNVNYNENAEWNSRAIARLHKTLAVGEVFFQTKLRCPSCFFFVLHVKACGDSKYCG